MSERIYIKPPRRNKFEDVYTLLKIEKIFRHKRGWVFRMPKKKESVILLVSGGLDSIALWNLLLVKYELNVYPIYFSNSKRKVKGEEKAINFFSQIFKAKYPLLFHKVFKKKYTPSFLFSNVSDKHKILSDLPNIINNLFYHPEYDRYLPILINNPTRLGNFAFGAYEYAHHLKYNKGISIQTIFVGIVPEDRGFRESTLAVIRSINLSLCLILGNFLWQFTAPIEKHNNFYFTKRGLFNYALKSNLPIFETWSCNKEVDSIHCGSCFNCAMRISLFSKSGIKDATFYKKKYFIDHFMRKIIRKKSFYKMSGSLFVHRKKILAPKINLNTRISVAPGVVWHELNGSLYTLKTDTGLIEQLNHSGSLIWKEITRDSNRISDIMSILKAHYDTEERKLRNDLVKFIKRYIRRGYLIAK